MSQPDLVDRLARRSIGANRWIGKAKRVRTTWAPNDGTAGFERRFSRGSALKLGLLGAVSAATGLWRSPPARAQAVSRGECLELCVEGYDLYLNNQKKACFDVFAPEALRGKSNWIALRRMFRYGGYSFVWDGTASWATLGCLLKAQIDARRLLDECVATCRDTCPRRRSLQSAASPTAPTCEVKRPPKSKPPQIPPPPATQFSPCGGGDVPTAPYCCRTVHSPYGVVPCQAGCHRSGEGCCGGGSDCA